MDITEFLTHQMRTIMNQNILLPLFLLLSFPIIAQQTIRGVITDKDSKQTIPYATIVVKDSNPVLGATSNDNGQFELQVPLGKNTLEISYIGYETYVLPNINVTAGKEVVLEIELVESFTKLEGVVVVLDKPKEKTVNEFSAVSARSLNVEEANLYAASIGDPARQAQNFAGVAGAGDDLNNEIVVRGNSPNTLLWRLEGVEIPNPNHFANLTGGSVSMLSSNMLAKSDFFTSAFPAEYGNGIAGVFDLRFRKGNNNKREFTIDAGVLGLGIASEGPFKKNGNASYLVNYRYSTLNILKQMGVDVTQGFNPNYQDLNLNINLPAQKAGVFNVYGLLGINKASSNDFEIATNGGTSTNFVNEQDDNSKTGILGLGHRIFLNDKTYLKSNLTHSSEVISRNNGLTINGISDPTSVEEFDSNLKTVRLSSFLNHKFNSKQVLRGGVVVSYIKEKTVDKSTDDDGTIPLEIKVDGNSTVLQSYLQWKYRITERVTLNSGLHFLHYNLTRKSSMDPRLGLDFRINSKQSINFGAGIHSRAERLAVYLLKDSSGNFQNKDLDLSKALHFVLGYNLQINEYTRLKMETYYQSLFDIPVINSGETRFSSINAGLFDFFETVDLPLTNDGKGVNYGIELTLEQFLNKGFYYLTTLSLYESKYKIGNSSYYNTRFNGNYVFNFLSGKEFAIGNEKNDTFGINAKFTLSGGQRYTAVDEMASINNQSTILSTTPFTEQVKVYYRFDLGFNYQWNRTNTTHTLSLNIQNVTNRLNDTFPNTFYNSETNSVITSKVRQNGLIPVLKYSLNF